ncbi:MAG: CoB--CoM heterodisulfide reductase iron-sulfur subunit B family protein [Dehalococcoidales bacterium]|nr:CoB--CoM heterodisulfide reductase iron-sulfur subunit B family protein [Dehalococcoidales bacterium]
MMEYGYYPGCSLHSTAKEFDLSIKESFKALGLTLKEVPDWNCCGASSAHETSEELALGLSIRVLSQAEHANQKTIIAPCAACYSRLKMANIEIAHDAELKKRINQIIGQDYTGGVTVKHLTEIYRDNKDKLASTVVKPLTELKIASYYGCLLARPKGVIDFDDAENPTTMDELVTVLGAQAVDWSHKTECCGASFSFSRIDIALRLVGDIMDAAKLVGADVIAVACPLCQANLDMRQGMAAQRNKTTYDIPIIYISQLIGLAQGKSAKALGLDKHVVSVEKVIGKLNAPPPSPEKEKVAPATSP